jgi:PAS domain S-box-containing protein
VLDRLISELDYNESPEQTAEHIRQIIEHGQDRFETRHRHKDGHPIDIEVSTYYQPDGNGGRFYAFLRDISRRKQAENALRESESRYRTLIANLPGIAYRCAMDADWTMAVFSGEVESLTGYPASDFLDKHRSFASIIHPDDVAMVEQAIRSRVSQKIGFEIEYRLCHAHGHTVIVHENGQGIYDENGELLWLDGFIWDITERTRTEQALIKSEERYRAVVEDQTELISRLRADGTLIFANEIYCRFFGKSEKELIGKTWHPVAFPEDRPEIEAKLGTLSPSNPVVIIENRVYSASGDVRWMQFVNRAFFNEAGQIAELQSVGRDITDKKKAEQALLAAKDFKRAILDAVSTQIAVLDQTGTIIEVNESWRRFAIENIGPNSQAIFSTDVGINYLDVCRAAQGAGAEGAQEAVKGIRAVLDGRLDAFTQEYPCHTSVNQRWFMMTVTPLDRTRSGVVVSHSDISAPRLLAEKLRDSETLLERAQTMAKIGSWELDIASSRLHWSDETNRIFGARANTPRTTTNFLACVHPDDREMVDRAWGAALDGAPYDIEHRILVDGETKWVHEQADIRFDCHGKPVCAYGFVQDIDARKQAELALRQSDARSRSILRAAPIGIGVIMDRIFLEVNEAMTTMTGYKTEELLGHSVRMLYPTQADYDYVGTEKYRQIEAHGIGSVETRWCKKNGEIMDVLLSSSPIVMKDLSQGLTFSALDITYSKQAEQDRLIHEASQRDALVRDVHHRIKNNLQGVIGLLRQHIANYPDTQAPIEAAITQVNTIAVIHGLQSRMPQNELRIRELLHEVNGAAAAMAMALPPPEIEDTLSGEVWLDSGAAVTIALIINELLQNALKHRDRADSRDTRVSLGGDSQHVSLHIWNPGGPLPHSFDLLTGQGCGTGLDLVRTLLPRRGAGLVLNNSDGGIEAVLVLTAPVIVDPGTLVNRRDQDDE